MKSDEQDKLFGDGAEQLDVKDAAVMNKYLLAGMALLSESDTKTK